MELTELIPQKVNFKLSSLERELHLNMLTLDDNVWLEENYPNEKMKEIFDKVKVKDLMRIIARILDNDSKKYLKNIKIVEVNDYGDEAELTNLTMADKLLKIAKDGEIIVMLKAFSDVRMKSNELVKKLTEEFTEDQKKRENQ